MEPLKLDTLESDAWQWLSEALSEQTSSFRTPVVATVDGAGRPHARTVVLRAVEPWTLEFHTDVRSPKYAWLRERSSIAWLFYDPQRLLQIRAEGAASLHTDDAVADAAWNANPLASRAPYMGRLPSGTPIDAPDPATLVRDEAHSVQGRPHFCAVRCRIESLDVLQLHPEGHRRARVQPGRSLWVAP